MSPKDKAKQLLDSWYISNYSEAKKNAVRCMQETINEFEIFKQYLKSDEENFKEQVNWTINFYKHVIDELLKL